MRLVSLPRRTLSLLAFSAALVALAAEAPRKMFDIPAGPAERTLRRFTEQSGLQIAFPSEIADGVRTNAIKGELTPLAAADELFAGTSLRLVQDPKTGAYSVARTSPVEKNAERAAPTAASDRPVPSLEPASAEKSSAPVTLTPFEVRTDRDEGYLANNTLSGSRLNTALKDTPASINVFTKEFMQDIGAFNLDDVLQYGMNLQFDRDDAGGFGDSPNGNNTVGSFQGYRVRGVNISLARNYFTSGSIPRDTFNVERVEQSRGPNSVLFGIGSAGGVVNISNKTGIIGRSFQNIRLSAGSFGSWRTELDVNQSLSGKLAARLNLVKYRAGTYRLFQDGEGYAGHVAVKYRVLPRVEIRGELERGHLRDNSPRNTALLDFNSYWLAAGRPLLSPTDPIPSGRGAVIGARLSTTTNGASLRFIQSPGETSGRLVTMANQIVTNGDNIPVQDDNLVVPQINTQGPTADRIANYTTGSAFVNVELAKNLYVEAAFNHEQVSRPVNWNATQSERFRGDPNTTLPGTLGPNPYAGRFFTETNWQVYDARTRADRGRVSISAEQDFGRWGFYRAAVLGEEEQRWSINTTYLEVYAGRPFNSVPENAANQVIRRAYFVTNQWDTYYETGPAAGLIKGQVDPISGRTLSSELVPLSAPPDVRYLQKGLLGALQASYFKNRLVIGAGLRRDIRDDFTRAYIRSPTTNAFVRDIGKGASVTVSGRTYTLGAVAHITKNIDLIYNRSDNFNLPTAGQQVLVVGSSSGATVPAPNPAGQAQEYGIAISLLDGKLYGRAIHYQTDTVDQFSFQGSDEVGPTSNQLLSNLVGARLITQADADAHSTKNTGYLSDRSADGYEFQLTANPTKNWRFTGSFAISNASASGIRKTDYAYWEGVKKYLSQFPDRIGLGSSTTTMATEIAQTDQALADSLVLNGGGLVGNRKYLTNFFTRYAFSNGWLKGAWVGGGYNWKSKMLIGRNTSLAGLPVSQQLQWSAPVGEANAALGYTLRVFDKHPINLSLNIRNLFDETEPIITRRSADAAEIVRRMIYRAPRSWQVTADYKF